MAWINLENRKEFLEFYWNLYLRQGGGNLRKPGLSFILKGLGTSCTSIEHN